MRRRWAIRVAVSVATGAVAAALLLSLETTLAPAGATASLAGAGAAGIVVAIALLPATARYPQGVLRRARRVTVGAVLGVGTVGFAGYAGADVLPGPLALVATGGVLVAVLPVAYERGWRTIAEHRTLVAGDDPTAVRRVTSAIDPPPVGYCAPPSRSGRTEPSHAPSEEPASTRSDRAAAVPTSGSAPGAPSEPAAQRDGDADRSSERATIQQPDGGSVGLSPGGSGQRQPGHRPTASESARPPTPADSVRSTGSDRPSGSPDVERLAGLSALDRVVRDRGVDAVVLRFATPDRDDFFCALRTCHAAGVDAFVPGSRARSVVLAGERLSVETVERDSVEREPAERDPVEPGLEGSGSAEAGPDERDPSVRGAESDGRALAPVALEVLPWHGRIAKRGFDLAFATIGIVALSPLMTVIAIAIRLDSPGPVLYGQWRTGHLGEPFQLLKFRSMVSGAEAASGPRLSDEDAGGVDPRVTRVGRVLRATHLDELPQLFSILVGEMSVVGPRPERPALDAEIAADGVAWRQRWFLKPGLTGLAQINAVTGFQPREKLAYDLEYAERQSLPLDVRIVAIQLGQVAGDVLELLARRVR